MISRRQLFVSSLAAGLAGGMGLGRAAPTTVRIGFQKSSTLLMLLKQQGTLESGLVKLGVKVTWSEFTSGLPLLEALNIGAVDLSADVADTVPVFAQAAGARLVYLAQETPSPSAQAFVVPASSKINTLADLKGKKVGVAKAAGSHYLLIAALERGGLKFSDIEPAYLTPADGRAAFERGAIDAWVIWDPFLAAVQRQSNVRILTDGTGIADYQRYYLTTPTFAAANPAVLELVFASLKQAGQWTKANPAEAAKILAPAWGLDIETAVFANSRRSYEVRLVTKPALAEQQRIADAFLGQGLLPKRIDALDVALWAPPS